MCCQHTAVTYLRDKPVLHTDKDNLEVLSKVRGRGEARNRAVTTVKVTTMKPHPDWQLGILAQLWTVDVQVQAVL